ncbi:unnamed protein product [Withania somnifera]
MFLLMHLLCCVHDANNCVFPGVVVYKKPLQWANPLLLKNREAVPQNVDLPPVLPKKKKKPYPIPLKKIQQAARADKKLAELGEEKKLEPPKSGLLVCDLIPAAYELLDDWKLLIKGLAQLLYFIPIHACSECSQIHVAQKGHEIQDCLFSTNSCPRNFHSWSYHMYDPFGTCIKHETRFNYDRIPAVVELCIQAGVDLPGYPSRRRSRPIRMMGKKVNDIGGLIEEPRPSVDTSSAIMDLDTHRSFERFAPPLELEVPRIAQDTIDAYELVKQRVTRLMKKYTVKVWGYYSEVHVGPLGVTRLSFVANLNTSGGIGWQHATVDEVFPPNNVWHIQDPKGPPLRSALKRFYGKAPAVVEYKPMMRLDIVLSESEDSRLVA